MRYSYCTFLMIVVCGFIHAYDFKAVNERGDSLAFNILTDSTVEFTYDIQGSETTPSYNYLTCDTLWIPDSVKKDDKTYIVNRLGYAALDFMNPCVKVAFLPKTIVSVGVEEELIPNGVTSNTLESFMVDSLNSTFSAVDGILYSLQQTHLVAYPCAKKQDSVVLAEGINTIETMAFSGSSIKYLELPLTLRTISELGLGGLNEVSKLIVKDSIEEIGDFAFVMKKLSDLTFGSGLQTVSENFIVTNIAINIYCRAINPPIISLSGSATSLDKVVSLGSRLLVPRQSINAYRQADGWKNFGENILPIEPPVVSTEEGVSISWVQSFSATGYVWYLYKDEAHTQLAMSLAFDKDGRLQEIVLNSPAPQRVEAEDVEEGNNEAERFAEYFSFTIKNLSANTNYYYLRQTLCQGEVIETEEGTFNTTPGSNTPTAIQGPTPSLPAIEGEDKVTKILQDGTILLLRNGKRYGICGEERQ